MKQKEALLDDLFHELQASYMQATPEEKRRVAAQVYSWAEQQNKLPSVHAPGDRSTGVSNFQERHPLSEETEFHTKNDQEMQDLATSGSLLNQITENIEQVIWLRDRLSGRILYVSPAFDKIWGRSSESLYSDPIVLIESVHPEDRVQVMAAQRHDPRKPFDQTYRILRPDGSLRWIFVRTFLIQDESGASDSVFAIAQDITEQKQIEQALRKTLDRTHEQFNLSRKLSLARKPESVLKILMSAYELRSAQRAALLFFDNPNTGATRDVELTASWHSSQDHSVWSSESNLYDDPTFWDLLQPNRTVVISDIQSDPRLSPFVRNFLFKAQTQTLVIFPLVTTGNRIGSLLVYYPSEYRFDRIKLHHLKVLVDLATITLYNLRLLEVEAESRHEAERANEIKTEFLAMISHELRTPLTSIIGFTTTLLAEDVNWQPDEQIDFIQTIQQEANRLQELINHLLDLSRIEAGMLPIVLEPHFLPEIMNDAISQFKVLTGGHVFSMHLPANLPPVYADVKRITQVMVNLVRNSSTYAPKGTEISISASLRGSFVQININDQGPGIPLAEHKGVFKAFQRGESVENGLTQGAGLGLAICKGLVHAHGGRIWIKKKAAPGTTISFTIPVAPEKIPANSGNMEN